jgi:hypothetical protein
LQRRKLARKRQGVMKDGLSESGFSAESQFTLPVRPQLGSEQTPIRGGRILLWEPTITFRLTGNRDYAASSASAKSTTVRLTCIWGRHFIHAPVSFQIDSTYGSRVILGRTAPFHSPRATRWDSIKNEFKSRPGRLLFLTNIVAIDANRLKQQGGIQWLQGTILLASC